MSNFKSLFYYVLTENMYKKTRGTKPTVLDPQQLMLHLRHSLVQIISIVKIVQMFIDFSRQIFTCEDLRYASVSQFNSKLCSTRQPACCYRATGLLFALWHSCFVAAEVGICWWWWFSFLWICPYVFHWGLWRTSSRVCFIRCIETFPAGISEL